MRHLANAQYWDRPVGGNTGRLFLAFGGPVCVDRISNCPLDRVLTYKNLIYLLNLQISLTKGFLETKKPRKRVYIYSAVSNLTLYVSKQVLLDAATPC